MCFLLWPKGNDNICDHLYSENAAYNEFLVQEFATDTMATKSQILNAGNIAYRPVYKHWFYNQHTSTTTEDPAAAVSPSTSKVTTAASKWIPFSMADSMRLQDSVDAGTAVCITNGGRFDVQVKERRRVPVYWTAAADEVRCCSWFFKGSDSRLVPYDEELADRLEAEYKEAAELGEWNRKITLDNGDMIVFHAPNVMVHFTKSQSPDSWAENSVRQMVLN